MKKKIKILDAKKITIMNLHLGTGGIEKYIASLTKMLSDTYKIKIISTYKISDQPAFSFSDNIDITYLINDYPRKEQLKKAIKQKNIIKIIKYGFQLIKIVGLKYYKNIKAIKNDNSKVIITTRDFHNKLVGKYKNNGVIAIATEHNYHNNNKKYINKVIDSCRNINYLVLVSQNLKDFYQDKLKDTKCIYIPNVIDEIPEYKKKDSVNNRLISVGRLVDEKGFEDLIYIIKKLKSRISDISLDIYGDGPLRQKLENVIVNEQLESNIRIMGFLSHNKLIKRMNQYDIYVMSSYTESFGLVLIEALSNSVPVIAFDTADGAKNILKDGNGILIANRNIDEYANAIYNLLKDIKKLNQLSKKGYDSVQKYNIKNIKQSWIELLKFNK